MKSDQPQASRRWVHHSHETRRKAVRRVRAGEPVATVAADVGVTCETIYAWRRAADASGGSPPPPRTPGRRPQDAETVATLIVDLHRHLAQAPAPQRTLSAMVDWFALRSGRRYSASTVRRRLWRFGCSVSHDEMGGEGVWSIDPTKSQAHVADSHSDPCEEPVWLNEGRTKRILEFVRHGILTKIPLSLAGLLSKMPSLRADIRAADASDDDLRRALVRMGVTEAPDTGALMVG